MAGPFRYSFGGRRRVKSAFGTFPTGPAAAAPRGPWPKPYQAPRAPGWGGKTAVPAPAPPGAPPDPNAPDAAADPNDPNAPDFTGDSGYIAALARLGYNRDTATAALQQQGAYDRTDTGEAIRRLNERQGQDTQAGKENANKQGLLLSGYLGKKLGDMDTEYARSRGDTQQAFDRREAARQAGITGLQTEFALGDADAQVAAIARMLAGDSADADAGILGPQTSTDAVAAAPPAAAAPGGVKPAVKPTGKPRRRGGRLVATKGARSFNVGRRPARRSYQAPRAPGWGGTTHTGSF